MAEQLNAWERVQISRSAGRPTSLDYISFIFDDFIELHGDRCYGDDPAIVGGLAGLNGKTFTVIGQQKGRTTKENVKRNFGMPSPEGYRKALRLMKQAEKFHRPIICFVDTPGAYCGIEAEERGQGEAIARNLYEMAGLKVPILSIMKNATYSVLSPEGFAAILWKDGKRAPEAASVMKITASDLKNLQVVEEIIEEEEPIGIDNIEEITAGMREKIEAFVKKYEQMTPEEICAKRYERFRAF